MNLTMRKIQTHGQREQTCDCQGEEVWQGCGLEIWD